MERGYLLPEGCKDLIDVVNKSKKEWQHAELFVDLQRLQKVWLVEFKAKKPFWKPPA